MNPNPILQMLNNQQGGLGSIMQMVNTLRGSSNPMGTLNNMAAQNPDLQNAINMVNQNGGNPKDVFFLLAKQRGVDPNTIISMLTK